MDRMIIYKVIIAICVLPFIIQPIIILALIIGLLRYTIKTNNFSLKEWLNLPQTKRKLKTLLFAIITEIVIVILLTIIFTLGYIGLKRDLSL